MSSTATYRSRVNYMNVVFSMALVLFMLGLFGYALIYGRQLADSLRESINIVVELKESSDRSSADSLQAALRLSTFVKPESVRLISKEEAAKTMKEEFGEDFAQLGLPNPFFDVVTFNVPANYMHSDSLTWIRAAVREQPGVNDVFYQQTAAELVAANIKKVAWGALIIAAFFIFAAATLIHNTVRLALFANRFLIKNMELVGATWGFISRPYLKRAALHGFAGGLLAAGALWLLHAGLASGMSQWRELAHVQVVAGLCAALVFLGVLVTTGSTFFVVRKYLRLRVDDLF